MSGYEQYFRELVDGKREKLGDRLLLGCLKFLSRFYSLALRLRAFAYSVRLLRSRRLPRPVISVGNLTVGGTGKTPMVAWLASYLMGKGKRVVVLSRGYGGSARGDIRLVSDGATIFLSPEEAGDEPVLLAKTVAGLAVVIGADRYRAGIYALETLKPDIFILDDGFQHIRLQRDLNVLLVDSRHPFGNNFTLPAGLLREPVSAACRADVVVATRAASGRSIENPVPGKPFAMAAHTLVGMMPLEGGGTLAPFSRLKGMRVMAFSGIADPGSFFDALEREGVPLVATLAFPDHSTYGDEELAAICRLRDTSQSAILITTGKDAVKLAQFKERLGPCVVASLRMTFFDARPLEHAIEKLL
ncbi:MAG: tetraacyldisaccharide 4'-kinase [Geobacter sp.]|nr:MAG: tetraacyldisaccharide 4'-kinase [Geobacter sp.]